MRCGEAERRLSDDLDGALSPRRKARLEAHLSSCPDCRACRNGHVRLQAAAGDPADRSPEYWAAFERRLETKIGDIESGSDAAATSPAWRRWAFAALAVLALAAGIRFALARKGTGAVEAWIPSGDALVPLIEAAEADPGLEMDADRLIRASLGEFGGSPDADIAALSAADPLFWEGVSDDELRDIASELELENGPGGPK
jgi:anti-sigma factor RsiW